MSIKLIDSSGTEIKGLIKMQYVCDGCGNSAQFYNGMSTYFVPNDQERKSYCSEICVRKVVGL